MFSQYEESGVDPHQALVVWEDDQMPLSGSQVDEDFWAIEPPPLKKVATDQDLPYTEIPRVFKTDLSFLDEWKQRDPYVPHPGAHVGYVRSKRGAYHALYEGILDEDDEDKPLRITNVPSILRPKPKVVLNKRKKFNPEELPRFGSVGLSVGGVKDRNNVVDSQAYIDEEGFVQLDKPPNFVISQTPVDDPKLLPVIEEKILPPVDLNPLKTTTIENYEIELPLLEQRHRMYMKIDNIYQASTKATSEEMRHQLVIEAYKLSNTPILKWPKKFPLWNIFQRPLMNTIETTFYYLKGHDEDLIFYSNLRKATPPPTPPTEEEERQISEWNMSMNTFNQANTLVTSEYLTERITDCQERWNRILQGKGREGEAFWLFSTRLGKNINNYTSKTTLSQWTGTLAQLHEERHFFAQRLYNAQMQELDDRMNTDFPTDLIDWNKQNLLLRKDIQKRAAESLWNLKKTYDPAKGLEEFPKALLDINFAVCSALRQMWLKLTESFYVTSNEFRPKHAEKEFRSNIKGILGEIPKVRSIPAVALYKWIPENRELLKFDVTECRYWQWMGRKVNPHLAPHTLIPEPID